MNTRFKFLTYVLFALAITISSCEKEGPQGPPGKDGAEGQTGETGPAGEQGSQGVANIMYSDWLDQNINGVDSPRTKGMRVTESRLTPDFIENGGFVLGFFRWSESSVQNTPFTSYLRRYTRSSFVVISVNQIRFLIQSIDGSDLSERAINGTGSSLPQYKYVLIPGGVNITGKSAQADFKKMSYEEVMDHFGLDY